MTKLKKAKGKRQKAKIRNNLMYLYIYKNLIMKWFKNETSLITILQIEEITKRLSLVTESFYSESNKFKFEGKIFSNEFNILPTFDYGPRNQLRPEIIGKIYESDKESIVKLTFILPKNIKALMVFTLIINLAFTIFLYLKPISNFISWHIYIYFIITTFIIFFIVYNLKVNQSIKVICKLVEAKQIKHAKRFL